MAMNLAFDNKVLFNKLNEYFFDNIKMSLKTPDKIFMITKDDTFYEINIYDEKFLSFVLYNDDSVIKSMTVEKLTAKNIIDLSYGFCHYIARNNKNEIFCWGDNGCGQFGNGKRDNSNIFASNIDALNQASSDLIVSLRYNGKHKKEVELNELLSNLDIEIVKCGFWHSLALTKNGEVYACGLISSAESNEKTYQPTPMKVDGFDGEKVVMISCGYNHSMALTRSGRVFSWGENSHGQLGNENKTFREKPKLIELKNVSFKKISCGKCHSLLLSNDGVIYAFGDNRWGQIGNGSKEMLPTPVKLTHTNRFIDIASNFMEDISSSLSIDNLFYVWGKCKEEIFITPFQTTYASFDEIFSNFTFIQYEPSKQLIDFNDSLFRYGYYKREYTQIEMLEKVVLERYSELKTKIIIILLLKVSNHQLVTKKTF
jgi:alpha-tubulin suppressor-like RCC1 family protein